MTHSNPTIEEGKSAHLIGDPRYKKDGTLVNPEGALRTVQRESYCRYRHQGFSKVDAYMKAGYKPRDKKRAIIDSYNLEAKDDITARIYELNMTNDVHDAPQEARDNPTITPDYINSQMKLLLIQAKNEGQLKLARDLIKDMAGTLGMYNENKADAKLTALAPPHIGLTTINIQELAEKLEEPVGGGGAKPSEADIIDVEVSEITD